MKGIIQRGSLSKTQIGSFDSQNNNNNKKKQQQQQQMGHGKAHEGCFCALRNDQRHQDKKLKRDYYEVKGHIVA